jgi:hypothetical protein
MDWEGFAYQLETTHGKGFPNFLTAIIRAHALWRPKVIGIEKQPAQTVIDALLQKDRRFRRIEHLIQTVSHNNKGKDWRIEQFVAEPLKAGLLLLNPLERDLKDEMKTYVPGDKAVDNLLDSVAIAMLTAKKGRNPSGESTKDKLQRRKERLDARKSKYTGVRI